MGAVTNLTTVGSADVDLDRAVQAADAAALAAGVSVREVTDLAELGGRGAPVRDDLGPRRRTRR